MSDRSSNSAQSAAKMHVTAAEVRTTPALLLLLMWQWLLLIIPPCSNEPLVLMMGAKVKGLETTVSNRTVWKFLGIRYAKSTAGLERFQRPLPADLLAEIDGTRFGARCPTSPFDSGMSEDCLFLNVYTPKEARKLPVLVFIHGGGFVSGSSNDIDGEVLAAEGDIIVVTFNYRLGVLGFMCTGDNSSRGNYGLWDQRMALKWVETYIQYFGGDEKSVTLAGMSAGAASAAILSLSPVSRNLFRSVIQMSGSASSPWARVSPAMALETTRILASRLGCPSFAKLPTSALVSCLRNKPVAELTVHSEVMWDDTARALVDYAWVPVRDGEIVVDVETASSFQGPLLAGLVNNEGGTMQSWEVPRVSAVYPEAEIMLMQRSFLHHNLIPALLRQAYNVSTSTAALVVECFYSSLPEAVAASTRLRHDEVSDWEMSEIFGDVAYVYGTLKDLNRFSSTQASFLYYFDHQTNRRRVRGIRHVDDLAYLTGFVQPLAYTLDFRGNISEEDLQLSRHFRQLIVNFVKNGEPNTGGRPPSWPVWSPYTIRNGDYLVIGRSPRVAPHLKSDRMNFWTYDLPPLLTPSRNVSAKWRECLSSTMRTSGQQPTDSGTLRYWLLSACLCFTLAVLNR